MRLMNESEIVPFSSSMSLRELDFQNPHSEYIILNALMSRNQNFNLFFCESEIKPKKEDYNV